VSDTDELKAKWFEFGRKSGIKESKQLITKQIEELLADDFIGVFRPDGNTIQYSKADFIALIKGENK